MLKIADFGKATGPNISSQQPDSEESEPDNSGLEPRSQGRYISQPCGSGETKPFVGDTKEIELYKAERIRAGYDSLAAGFSTDQHVLQSMESLGLPTGFRLGPPTGRQDKAKKKTFYCEICLTELNSEDTMKSHIKGVKHMKKKQQVEAQNMMEGGEQRAPGVIAIPNPAPTRVKIPMRLHNRIKESREPAVGLAYVTEYIPESDPEMEPHYQCKLCGRQGIANGMFSHIMGLKHRQQFFETLFPNGDGSERNQMECLVLARQHAENAGNLAEKIKCIYSDLEYPWPPDKAPWSRERGGTGVPPPGAVGSFRMIDDKDEIPKPTPPPPSFPGRLPAGVTALLPAPASIPVPESREDALRYLSLSMRLAEQAVRGGWLPELEMGLCIGQLQALRQRLSLDRDTGGSSSGVHSIKRETDSGGASRPPVASNREVSHQPGPSWRRSPPPGTRSRNGTSLDHRSRSRSPLYSRSSSSNGKYGSQKDSSRRSRDEPRDQKR